MLLQNFGSTRKEIRSLAMLGLTTGLLQNLRALILADPLPVREISEAKRSPYSHVLNVYVLHIPFYTIAKTISPSYLSR